MAGVERAMHQNRISTAIFATFLIGTIAHAAEPKLIKSSDVPSEVKKSIPITLSEGSESKFFRYESNTPKVVWRVEVRVKTEKLSYVIQTRESVRDGKTNVTVVAVAPGPPKQ